MSIDIEELACLGAAVLAAQKLEFGIYGLAAHASHTAAAAKEKRFRTLTPEGFLRGDPTELKATLGQLVAVFGDEFLIGTAELNTYVDDRNLIYHNYWRLTRSSSRGSTHRLEHPVLFLKAFVESSNKLTSVINGFYALLISALAAKTGRDVKLTDAQIRDIKVYRMHAEQYLIQKQLRECP